MGGSDQWGNITAGIELIRKVRGKKAHGLVWPLMTTAAGTKFGKTEAGTVWLDPQRTSPFRFYQFWLNTDDRDVIELPEVLHVARSRRRSTRSRDAWPRRPRQREAQRTLAREVTTMVHGASELRTRRARVGGAVRRLAGRRIASTRS